MKYVFAVNRDSSLECIISGSSAEFYIKPPLAHVGDVDVMYRFKYRLTIPQGHTFPMELQRHYDSIVDLYEIIDSHKPGYVYLQRSCVLQKKEHELDVREGNETGENEPVFLSNDFGYADSRRYRTLLPLCNQIFTQEIGQFLKSNDQFHFSIHGPSLETKHEDVFKTRVFRDFKTLSECMGIFSDGMAVDNVFCFRCVMWPPQAAEWPTRSRSHGWPDRPTTDVIVNNGCDVVPVVHPNCQQDEWMSKYQWRLSFSRAEITLLNSWTPVQQIIYHMLRFVLKHEIFSKTKDSDKNLPKLCNYHIKTLMLWECEQRPQSWWSAESSFVKLCSSLLYKLCDWVADECCQQYFITNCNLLDHFVDDASLAICNSLKKVADVSFLLKWFVTNYVGKYTQFPSAVLSEGICSNEKLLRVIHAAIELSHKYQSSEYAISFWSHTLCFNSELTLILLQELQNSDMHLLNYFTAMAYLRAAYTTSVYSLSENMLEVLWTFFDPSTAAINKSFPAGHECAGILSVRKAVKLATFSGVRSNALEMLHNEIAKAYLHHSFACGEESTYSVVHLLLAVLYYKSSHYQATVEHCEQVLNQGDRGQYSSRSIGAEYLPQVDENVDSAFGLMLLYQHIQQNALNRSQQANTISKLAFTAALLAQYLYSKCTANSDTGWARKYGQNLLMTEKPLLSDVLLFKTTKIQVKECKNMCTVEDTAADAERNDSWSMDTTMLVTTLELVALEQLITARQELVDELHSKQFPGLNEFEALYAYKCGLYEQCLEICKDYVDHVCHSGIPVRQIYFVAFPELLFMLDGDLVSLWGIIRLLYPHDIAFLLMIKFRGHGGINALTLSLYLIAQCQRKLHIKSVNDTLYQIRRFHDIFVEVCHTHSLDEFDVDIPVLKLTYRSLKLYSDDSISAQ